MATYTITKAYQCEGGAHFHFTVSDGTRSRQFQINTDELKAPITDDEIITTFKVLFRSSFAGLKQTEAAAKLNSNTQIVVG